MLTSNQITSLQQIQQQAEEEQKTALYNTNQYPKKQIYKIKKAFAEGQLRALNDVEIVLNINIKTGDSLIK